LLKVIRKKAQVINKFIHHQNEGVRERKKEKNDLKGL
jgi:hypothetical protein